MQATVKITTPQNIYKPTSTARTTALLFPIISLLLSPVLFILCWKFVSLGLAWSAVGILLSLSIISYFWQITASLTVSENGLAYHTLGYSIFTPWENINGLDKKRIGGRSVKGLLLRKRAIEMDLLSGVERQVPTLDIRPWMHLWLTIQAFFFVLGIVLEVLTLILAFLSLFSGESSSSYHSRHHSYHNYSTNPPTVEEYASIIPLDKFLTNQRSGSLIEELHQYIPQIIR